MNILKYTVILSSVAFLAACSESSSSKKTNSDEILNPENLSVVSSHLEKVTCTGSSTVLIKSLGQTAGTPATNETQHRQSTMEIEITVEKLSDGKSERRVAKGTVIEKDFLIINVEGAEQKTSTEDRTYTTESKTLSKTELLADGSQKITNSSTQKNSLREGEQTTLSESIQKKVGSEIIVLSEKFNDADITNESANYRFFEIENGKEVIATSLLVKPSTSVTENFQFETVMDIQTCIKTIQ